MNPLNQIPIDPVLTKLVNDTAAKLAKETGHVVFMIVMKEDGKAHLVLEGRPDSGPLFELTKDVPAFLHTVAGVMSLSQMIDNQETRQ